MSTEVLFFFFGSQSFRFYVFCIHLYSILCEKSVKHARQPFYLLQVVGNSPVFVCFGIGDYASLRPQITGNCTNVSASGVWHWFLIWNAWLQEFNFNHQRHNLYFLWRIISAEGGFMMDPHYIQALSCRVCSFSYGFAPYNV